MRKGSIVLVFVFHCAFLMAQKTDNRKSGFDKTRLFTGGDITASFFNGGSVLGANPHFGYALTDWLSVAVKTSYIYTGQRDEISNKFRKNVISPGLFVRAFPLPFLFVQVQPEYNFIKEKEIYTLGSSYVTKKEVNTLLIGAGYCQGRESGDNNYFYFSVMVDVLKSPSSPYVNLVNGEVRLFPVMSAGFNIALFGGR
jgi:hypothetical protein